MDVTHIYAYCAASDIVIHLVRNVSGWDLDPIDSGFASPFVAAKWLQSTRGWVN